MMKMFIEHYIFEFLEPESLTPVGSIDLLEVRDIYSDDKFRKVLDSNSDDIQQKNLFFIEADSTMD